MMEESEESESMFAIPRRGCACKMCVDARARAERPRTYSTPLYIPYAFESELVDPEPAKPEPVYTHVLIDCYDDGGMLGDSAEPHTAESLLEAIEARKDQEGRYQVYKLGTLILDVSEE